MQEFKINIGNKSFIGHMGPCGNADVQSPWLKPSENTIGSCQTMEMGLVPVVCVPIHLPAFTSTQGQYTTVHHRGPQCS